MLLSMLTATRPIVVATFFIAFGCIGVTAQSLHFNAASREIIEARLGKYQGDDQQREATLKQLFSEVGCNDQQLSEQSVKGWKIPNVICVLPGSSNRIIVVGAHVDHFPKGDGVADNWTGAALLPSLYEGLKTAPHTHRYIFVGFSNTENGRGEAGSRFYARNMSKEEVSATDGMVNMDTLGLAHPVAWGREGSHSHLVAILLALAKQLNVEVTNEYDPGRLIFDSEPFSEERNIPSITVTSATREAIGANIIWTPKDKISAIRFDDYYQTYRLLAAYLVLLDQLSPAHKK
jgi:hypothetical protein